MPKKEKRNAVLYCRVRPTVKKAIKKYAKAHAISEACAIDFMLANFLGTYAKTV